MIDRVVIKKHGFYKDNNEKLNDSNLIQNLNQICIVEDITLRDVLKLLFQYESIKNFISKYSLCHIDEYKHLLEEDKQEDNFFEYLSVEATAGIDMKNNFGYCIELLGRNKNDNVRYGITSIEKILDKNIKIEEKITFTCYENNKLVYKYYENNFPINVFQFLSAILWEISFYGTPEQANKFWEKLNQIDKEKNIPYENVKQHFKILFEAYDIIEKISNQYILQNTWDKIWKIYFVDQLEGYEQLENEKNQKELKDLYIQRKINYIKNKLIKNKPDISKLNILENVI